VVTASSQVKIKPTKISPDYYNAQFAGNIGFISVGAGYSFWNNRINSSILYGFVPHCIGGTTIHTFASRNNLNVFNFKVNTTLSINPYLNLGVNFEPGQHSDLKLPKKYPEGYYATNSFYYPIGIGLKINTQRTLLTQKKASYYIEIGTLATYLFYDFISNQQLTGNIVSLAYGIIINK
jgi:hypothetical protein